MDDAYQLVFTIYCVVFYLGPSIVMTLIAFILIFRASFITLAISCLLFAAAVVLGLYNFAPFLSALIKIYR